MDLLDLRLELPELRLGFPELRLYRKSGSAAEMVSANGHHFKDAYHMY